ncbi:23520_t:CDS:1, partial [Cetraspora pellucida]
NDKIICQTHKDNSKIIHELLKTNTKPDFTTGPPIIPICKLTIERQKYLYEKVQPYIN